MKLKNLLIILILGIGMIACAPTKSQQDRVINIYQNSTEFYEYHVVYTSYYQTDSVNYYFAAKDKYEAQKLADFNIDLRKGDGYTTKITVKEIVFSYFQQYPYE